MSVTNNFIIFDENNTNIMSDDDYLTSPQRKAGVGNGIADPALHNKLFRQISIFISAFAESLSNKGYTLSDSDFSKLVSIFNNIALTKDYPKTLDDLTDVIISIPQNKQIITYNHDESKWENKTPVFSSLTDVPQTYSGQAGKNIRVKSTEDGLEFYTGSIDDNSITDKAIGNRTLIDNTILTSYTGELTVLLNGLLSMQKLITGKADGKTAPVTSLETLYNQADIGTLFIPAGKTYSPYTIAGRNKTYNKIYIKCQNDSGVLQNPTSLIVTIYVNDVLTYTSPTITTATYTGIVSLTITSEDNIKVLVSNTTGITGGVGVSIRQVNRYGVS